MSRSSHGTSYELLGCGWHGHALVGTDAAAVRPEDDLVVREYAGLRWHRCLRCDAWLPRPAPASPARPFPPGRAEIGLPLRGRELRERYVLRLIAVDRVIHCVVLAALAAAVFVFAADRAMLQQDFVRFVTALQAAVGGPSATTSGGVEGELTRLFAISLRNLQLTGVVLTGYAILEGVEAVGLWRGRRWAEYLTFVATALLLPLEIYEITNRPTVLKAVTLAINLAVVAYLVWAKRLFGLRGGERAQRARRQADSGWPALERATPRPRGDDHEPVQKKRFLPNGPVVPLPRSSQ
jgi:uncharacterized membrane protein (DUF2068 family)